MMQPIENRNGMWRQVGVCPADIVDRFLHAGLSDDGELCFISDTDETFFVWSISTNEIIWIDDGAEGASPYPALEEIIVDGFIKIEDSRAKGRYRIFGLYENHPKTEDIKSQIRLEIDLKAKHLILRHVANDAVLQVLGFAALSGDWAFASFSENGATIAVLEPYHVTFFRAG